jgi:hypothetical protein
MLTFIAAMIGSLAVGICVYDVQLRLESYVAKRHAND